MAKKKDKMFENPKNLFSNRINEIITDSPTKNLIEDLIQLLMMKSAEKDEKVLKLVEIYNLLGTEKFVELIDLCSGELVKFPTKEEFKESIQVALCYYYKNYYNMTWDEIKIKLEDQELSSVKLGIKISQLEKFMANISEQVQKRNNNGK